MKCPNCLGRIEVVERLDVTGNAATTTTRLVRVCWYCRRCFLNLYHLYARPA
jgi:uncharacterized protein with PIN domain